VIKQVKGRYTLEFRRYAVGRMKVSSDISALARELQVPRQRLYGWWKKLEPEAPRGPQGSQNFTSGDPEQQLLQEQLREVQQLLAKKALEVDFFKGALQKIEARRQQNAKAGGTASTDKSGR